MFTLLTSFLTDNIYFTLVKLVNDEAPVAIIEPLKAEYSKKVLITNETLLIVDFDTKPEDLTIQIEELSLFGKYFLNFYNKEKIYY